MLQYIYIYSLPCLESSERNEMNTIKEMPYQERPYERCRCFGPSALTDAELLAVILRTGTRNQSSLALAHKVLMEAGPSEGINRLMHKSYEELISISGIGSVKAMQLLCIGELSKRIWRKEASENVLFFHNPKLCAAYYMQEMKHLEREELRLAFLDTRQRFMSESLITVGTVNASLISVREILIDILKHQAVNVIMLHNHPSGNPFPSEDDKKVTEAVRKGCEIIGVRLNDHIIIGDNSYYSFREQGNL